MASKWVTFRDNVENALKFDDVTEEMKQQFTTWLIATALPLAQKAADNFTAQVKEQAEKETGWNKVRDLIVLPFIVNGALWLVETVLNKTQANAA